MVDQLSCKRGEITVRNGLNTRQKKQDSCVRGCTMVDKVHWPKAVVIMS